MKQMTIQDVQKMSLYLLDEFHSFCTANNIRYSLAYGTLIGAIRHNGFIPWDDDIDVVMPRPDYEKFCRTYKSHDGLLLVSPEIHNSYITFTRLCDIEKTTVKTPTPWCDQETGVWIDIFPIDGVTEDYNLHIKAIEDLKKQEYKIKKYRWCFKPFKEINGIKKILSWSIQRIVYGRNLKQWIDELNADCRKIPFVGSKYVGNLSYLVYGEKECYLSESFNDITLKEFDGKKYCVMSGYDHVLRKIYGNYMQLPPVEKRTLPHHFHNMYWK